MDRVAGCWSVAALAGALLMAQSAAHGQARCASQSTADGLEERGNALRLQQHDREALELFQQSLGLCHGARTLLRIGLAEGALGQWLEAERHVAEALSRRDDPWITAHRTEAEAQLQTIRRHIGSLELSGEGGPADLWVGNQRVAIWPMEHPLRVLAGTVVFSVRAPGYIPITRTAEVPPGGLARERVELVRQPAVATVASSVATVAPEASTVNAVGPTRAADDGHDRLRVGMQPPDANGVTAPGTREDRVGASRPGWVIPVVIVGGVLLAAGVGVGVWALTRTPTELSSTNTGWTVETIVTH